MHCILSSTASNKHQLLLIVINIVIHKLDKVHKILSRTNYAYSLLKNHTSHITLKNYHDTKITTEKTKRVIMYKGFLFDIYLRSC